MEFQYIGDRYDRSKLTKPLADNDCILHETLEDFILLKNYNDGQMGKLVHDTKKDKTYEPWKLTLINKKNHKAPQPYSDRQLRRYEQLYRMLDEEKILLYYPESLLLILTKLSEDFFIETCKTNHLYKNIMNCIEEITWTWNEPPQYNLYRPVVEIDYATINSWQTAVYGRPTYNWLIINVIYFLHK